MQVCVAQFVVHLPHAMARREDGHSIARERRLAHG